MSRIFISHSSDNNAEAVAIRDWLVAEGWDEFFLDIDPSSGIVSGERWQTALNEAADKCEAVLFLISAAWASSTWCQTEMQLAAKLNKRIFGLLVQDVPLSTLPDHITAEWQVVSLHTGNDHQMFNVVMPFTDERRHVTFSRAGLKRLKVGLLKAGLDPRAFAWPPAHDPGRLPYRGLRPLEAEDAGIFFGREAAVVSGLQRLREMAAGPAPRCLVILGASGAGKSSFLRAGLLPRIQRDDRQYLPLPIVRAGRAALSGETGLIQCLEAALAAAGIHQKRAALRAAVQGGAAGVLPLLKQILSLAAPFEESDARPTIVIPIDQGEELFTAEARGEAEAFLAILRALMLDPDIKVLALFTIRSDSYEMLQTAPALDGVRQEIFSLPPIPLGAFDTMIEGPARRLTESGRPLRIEPALTAALLEEMQDTGGRDLLPLLSFTLEKLFIDYGGEGDLTLAEYQEFGGMSGAVAAAVALAFERAAGDPRVPAGEAERQALLRRALVPWLAGVDPHTGSPRRRVARLSEIPADARPLVGHLVEARILATDVNPQTGETTVEPAHEALLRQWKPLRSWLAEDAVSLSVLENVRSAAREWGENERHEHWLVHAGARLSEAEALLSREDLSAILDPADQAYLNAARAAENSRRDDEVEEARKLAAAQKSVVRRTFAGLVAALVLAVAAGGFGWYGLQKSREATAFAAEAQMRASEARENAARADESAALAESRAAEARARADEALRNETISLAALSRAAHLEGLPAEAIKLALAAWPRAGDEARPMRPQTVESLARALPDHAERLRFSAHGGRLSSIAFSPDGRSLISSSLEDLSARVFSPDTGAESLVIPGFFGDAVEAAWSPDGTAIVTGSIQGNLFKRDARTGVQSSVFVGHGEWTNSIRFSGDGARLLSSSNDDTARLWDVGDGRPLAVFAGHAGDVQDAALSPDGTLVATAGSDGTARLWSAADGTELRVVGAGDSILTAVGFSSDGTILLVGGLTHGIEAYKVEDGSLLAALPPASSVQSLALSPDGAFVAGGSGDGTVRLWRMAGTELLTVFRGHEGPVRSLAFSPDGRLLASASDDGTARVWTVQPAPDPLVLVPEAPSAVLAAAFSPDGTEATVAGEDGIVRVWDPASGGMLREFALSGAADPISALTFSPDGETLAVGRRSGAVSLHDPQDGTERLRSDDLGAAALALAFSPDGTLLAVGGETKEAVLVDARTGETLRRLPVGFDDHDGVTALRFSVDGRRLAAAASDSAARVFETDTGAELSAIDRDGVIVTPSALSPGLERAASFNVDGVTAVFSVGDGAPVATLRGDKTFVLALSFSPDGSRLATGGVGAAPAIWDAQTGAELARFFTDANGARALAFSPDGTRLLVGSNDGAARLWDVSGLPGGDLFQIACARLGSDTSLDAVEARYGLSRLSPICGAAPPRPMTAAAPSG